MKAYVMSLLKMHLHIGPFQNEHKRCLVFNLEFRDFRDQFRFLLFSYFK